MNAKFTVVLTCKNLFITTKLSATRIKIESTMSEDRWQTT